MSPLAVRPAKKSARAKPMTARTPVSERLGLNLPSETAATLREIAKAADVTVEQVVTVILATRIVTERQARKPTP